MDRYRKSIHRLICAVLCLLLTVTPLAQAVEPNDPAYMTASRDIINFIEDHEGFSEFPYGDSNGPSIGYGTRCGEDEYPDGITEEEAEALLIEHISGLEEKLNELMALRSVSFSQCQFDALISLTYNIGTSWMSSSTRLYKLLFGSSFSTQEFMNAFGIWCHVGSQPHTGLIERRIREINIFLHDYYQGKNEPYPAGLPKIVYMIFDANGGKVDNDVQFYEAGDRFGSFPSVSKDGSTFLGWYTSSGRLITESDIASENLTVTAKWDEIVTVNPGPGTVTEPEPVTPPVTPNIHDRSYYDDLFDTTGWKNPFKDAYSNTWYYPYVCALTKAEIISGYPDGTFKPNGNLTCGEALRLILGAAGFNETAKPGEHWASGYYNAAIDNGYISFIDISSLDAKISRRLVAKITARALGISASDAKSPFGDTEDPYAVALYNAGIISGSDEGSGLVYRPDANLTRAEVCVIVWKMMLYQYEQSLHFVSTPKPVATTPEPVTTTPDPVVIAEPSVPSVSAGYDAIQSYGYFEYNGRKIKLDERLEPNKLSAGSFTAGSKNRVNNPKAFACGIDVSSWQGDIDWDAVAADGIDFAIIRVGYRGYSEGKVYIDQNFLKNIRGALAAGLDVGVYFYSQAINAEEAIEEAEYTLALISGFKITYPVFFDWEPVSDSGSRTATYDTELLTECTEAFCSTVKKAGYKTGFYFNRNMAYLKYDLGALNSYDFWFAEYTNAPTLLYSFDMWQYSSSASVNGINTDTDINLCFKNYRSY